MKLPYMSDPKRYEGLYVFDFGGHVSVGYTADEIQTLLQMERYAGGSAFRIHRVDDSGRVEMSGVTTAQLEGTGMMLFAWHDADVAAERFSELRRSAHKMSPPCDLELALIDVSDFSPPHALVLEFARAEADRVAGWLCAVEFGDADRVAVDENARTACASANPSPIARHRLAGSTSFRSRGEAQLLTTVDQPFQR